VFCVFTVMGMFSVETVMFGFLGLLRVTEPGTTSGSDIPMESITM
jgi:hypothetical protein